MRTLFGVLTVIVTCEAGYATSLDRTLSQLHLTEWTSKDGAPSQITALEQTADGYLWIGSARGLFRFDGVTFERYIPPAGVRLPAHNVYALLATPDGGLWISFRPSGIGFLKGHSLTVFSRPEELPSAQVYAFAWDATGRLWAGTHNGLELRVGSRWVAAGDDWNIPRERIWCLFIDRQKTLWVAAGRTVFFLPHGARRFEPTSVKVRVGINKIAQTRDGRVWIGEMEGPLRPVQGKPPQWVGTMATLMPLVDRDGALWAVSREKGGLLRVRFPERDSGVVEMHDGLPSKTPGAIFEDREGNVWLGSGKGLMRFRDSHFVPFALAPDQQFLTLHPGKEGELYVASSTTYSFARIRGDEVTTVLAPSGIASVCRDLDGEIWWGAGGGVIRQRGMNFEIFEQPPSLGIHDWLWEVIPDAENGGLWLSVGDVGLVHFKDGVWSSRAPPPGLLQRGPSATFRDSQGRIWFGYTENRAALLESGRARLYTSADGIDIGRIRVIRGRGPHTWFGGELGLALFRNGRFRSILTKSDEPFGTVTGIIATEDGALWLNEMRGIVRLSPQEVRRIVENPAYRPNPKIFDFLDGLRGSPQMTWTASTATQTTDGRLWFATDNGLVWTDPARMRWNRMPPTVIIRTLEADRVYRPAPGIALPPKTDKVHFRYTATSLSIPERVRFRYKLEGVDEQWQDAGTRREAFYTRLDPGDYTFRVIASNEDGVWNDRGATLRFRVQPAWYQTNAFRAACAILAFFMVWALYRLRVRQIEAAAAVRFDERLAERTRLAREMHDTLLQTIQGSKMVADDALDSPADPAGMRRAMQQLSAWLGRAMAEGRAALHSLRTSTTQGNDLLEAMQRATESEAIPRSMNATCTASGVRREMHPIVRDEIYRIGYEGILNAAMHSGASRLSVELEYGHNVTLRLKDDGVGIEPELVDRGKPGHFGLLGMRERAARIEATLTIASAKGAGTTITLIVPGGIAFRKEHVPIES